MDTGIMIIGFYFNELKSVIKYLFPLIFANQRTDRIQDNHISWNSHDWKKSPTGYDIL